MPRTDTLALNGDRIRHLRKQRTWTIEQLATRAEISAPYLSQIERGHKHQASERVAIRLARELGVDTDAIATGEAACATG